MRAFRFCCALILMLAWWTSAPLAKEVAGLNMPEFLEAEEATLKLNGAGIRRMFFIDLYAAGLYLPSRTESAEEIIRKDGPMAIRMEIISSLITGDRMASTTRESFVKATNGNTVPIQPEIERLLATFKDQVEKGDIYELVYVPGEGTRVYKNAELKTVVRGLLFKQALFAIYLSDDPIQKNLKENLLGK